MNLILLAAEQDSDNIFNGALIIFGGMFVLACSLFDVNWFFNHWKSALIVKLVGRQGARVFYGLFGLIAIGVGGYFVLSGLLK